MSLNKESLSKREAERKKICKNCLHWRHLFDLSSTGLCRSKDVEKELYIKGSLCSHPRYGCRFYKEGNGQVDIPRDFAYKLLEGHWYPYNALGLSKMEANKMVEEGILQKRYTGRNNVFEYAIK